MFIDEFSQHELLPVRSRHTLGLHRFFNTLYRHGRMRLNEKGTDKEFWPRLHSKHFLASTMGLLANTPIAGIPYFDRISKAATLIAAVSDVPGVRGADGALLGKYHAFIINSRKYGIIGVATIERNPDPAFENRGDDMTRGEVSLWMVPRTLRGATAHDFNASLVSALVWKAEKLGFKTLEAVTSHDAAADLAIANSFTDTGKVKKRQYPYTHRRILTRKLG